MKIKVIKNRLALVAFIFAFSFMSVAASAKTTFSDVKEDAWYYKGVEHAVNNEYMVGTSRDHFNPNLSITRAQLAQIMYAYDGKPDIQPEPFVDAPSNTWYSRAATYVTVSSTTGFNYPPHLEVGYFDPYASVTREQAIFVLYHFSWNRDKDMRIDNSAYEIANKLEDINEECKTPFAWAISQKIISGTKKGLEPKLNVTRAQMATILYAYDKLGPYYIDENDDPGDN